MLRGEIKGGGGGILLNRVVSKVSMKRWPFTYPQTSSVSFRVWYWECTWGQFLSFFPFLSCLPFFLQAVFFQVIFFSRISEQACLWVTPAETYKDIYSPPELACPFIGTSLLKVTDVELNKCFGLENSVQRFHTVWKKKKGLLLVMSCCWNRFGHEYCSLFNLHLRTRW